MRSKTSCFNMGLCRSLLKRFWPLYLAWLCLLLVLLPVRVSSYPTEGPWASELNRFVLLEGIGAVKCAIAAALLSAMAVFSHLFNRRDCALINSLPLRREGTFITLSLTGLLPLLAGALLAWLAGLLAFAGMPIDAHYVHLWLLTVVLSLVAFYGLAVFCAMLTGNILILPVLFLALNVVADGMESLFSWLCEVLVYGFRYGNFRLTRLSPLIWLNRKLGVSLMQDELSGEIVENQYVLEGLGSLAVYALVGLVLLAVSLLLYRRRQMETTGDVVAVKPLRPVFRICAGLCCGLLLAAMVSSFALNGSVRGRTAAALCLVLAILGAALGYYIAEMLLQKSLWVFRSTRVGGLAAVCALLCAVVCCLELDVFGYEKRIPPREQILAVALPNLWRQEDDPEIIDRYLQLHAKVLENKEHNEAAQFTHGLNLEYVLTDGSRVIRGYEIDADPDWAASGNSEVELLRELNSLPQVKLQNCQGTIPVDENSLLRCEVLYESYVDVPNGDMQVAGGNLRLNTEQALELYRDCVLPDTQDSSLGTFYWDPLDNQTLESNVSLIYELADPADGKDPAPTEGVYRDYIHITVTMDAQRTIAWLTENTGIQPALRPEAVVKD